MRRELLLLLGGLLALLLLPSCADLGPPGPGRSHYVISTGAGFSMRPGRGVCYSMEFELRRFFAHPVYVVALFENPDDASRPLRVEKKIEAETLGFALESPPLSVLTNYKEYSVELFLYADSAHAQMLGRHHQNVLFSIPPEQTSTLEQQFSIRIL